MNVLSITSLVVSVLAAISYVPVSKIPNARRTMWPTWALFGLGAAVAVVALIVKPDAFAVSTLVLFILFAISYMLFLRVPGAAGRPQVGQMLPHFQVIAEGGKTVSPDDFVGKGPLLLVFFRGFW